MTAWSSFASNIVEWGEVGKWVVGGGRIDEECKDALRGLKWRDSV